MKFRKVMAVVLAAALTFSMAACGDKSGTGDATPTTGAQEGTDKPSVPSTPAGKNEEITIYIAAYHTDDEAIKKLILDNISDDISNVKVLSYNITDAYFGTTGMDTTTWLWIILAIAAIIIVAAVWYYAIQETHIDDER